MPVPLSVGKRGVFLLHDGGEGGSDDTEAFVEVPVGDYQRNEDANHIVESSGGGGDEAGLVAILGDGLGFGVCRLAGFRVAHNVDGAHTAEAANVADQWPIFLAGQRAVF